MSPKQALDRAEKAVRRGDIEAADEYLTEYYEITRDHYDKGVDRAARLEEKLDELSRSENPPYKPPASGNLPKHGKDILKNVYTSARERGFDQEAAARQAWCAVKRYYYKRGTKWVKRKDPVPSNEYPPGCGPPERNWTMKSNAKSSSKTKVRTNNSGPGDPQYHRRNVDLTRVKDPDDRENLKELIVNLDEVARNAREHSTKEAGLGDVDSGYATGLMDEDADFKLMKKSNVSQLKNKLLR